MWKLFLIWTMWMLTVVLLATLDKTVLLNIVLWVPLILLLIILIAIIIMKVIESKDK